MASPAKTKGKNNERIVAEIFSKATKLTWMRVPSSGAFLGMSNAHRNSKIDNSQRTLFLSDLIPPDEFSHVSIEVKSRKNFPFHQLFTSCKEMNSWIDQVETSVKGVSDHCNDKTKYFYAIVFKINNCGHQIVYPKAFYWESLPRTSYMIYNYRGTSYIIETFNEDWIQINLLNNPHFNQKNYMLPNE
jgi:hypothetical protein